MDENNYRRRPHLEDAREKRDSAQKSTFFLTGFQITVCVICLFAALGLKQFGGKYYDAAKVFVKDALQKSITSEEVTQVFHNIRDNFPDAAEVFSSGVTSSLGADSKTQSGATAKAADSSSQTSAASSDYSKSSQSSSKASKSSSAATKANNINRAKTSSASAVNEDEKKAAGTIDCHSTGIRPPAVNTTLLADSSQQAPSGTSLAPFKVTIPPVTPVSGRITSAFGFRTNSVSGQYSFHTGMDIAAAEGTPIAAAYSGIVEDVGKSAIYGNFVILDNGGEIKTFYGHCDTVAVKKGQTVKAGETIAKVGSTGNSTGFHLHFEIRVNNVSKNPQWVL